MSNLANALEDALLKAFNLNSLDRMLRRHMGLVLEQEIDLHKGLRYIVGDLVQLSIQQGWRDELLQAAIEEVPQNPFLRQAAQVLQVLPERPRLEVEPTNPSSLEKIVRERGIFLNWQYFTQRLSAVGRYLCRIEIPEGNAVGTGWLVHPDLVLTNYHVVEEVKKGSIDVNDVTCRFDYFVSESSAPSSGVTCKLARPWCIDSSSYATSDVRPDAPEPTEDELDYALLRLDRPVGEERLQDTSALRGWFHVSAASPVVMGDDILLVPQHPDGRSLELSFGRALNYNSNATRLRHDANTESGSSGSPCLTVALQAFGLHHAGGPSRVLRYNQCVPLRQIIQRMNKQSLTPFWEG